MVAQRRALVVGAEHAALLQERDDLVDEVVEAVRREVGHEDVAVGGVGLHVAVDRLGDRAPALPTNAERAVTSMTSSRMLRPLLFGQLPPAAPPPSSGSPSWRTRPRVIEVLALDVGVDVGQRTVGVVGGQVAAPHLLEEGDRALRADLLEADVRGPLAGLGVGVADAPRWRPG